MKKDITKWISSIFLAFLNITAFAQTQSFPANKTYPYGLMATNKNGQDAAANYSTWKTNYLEACNNGRFRVKFDDRSQTVSEGIGYGMLLSAYATDRTIFDGLWNYYKDNRNGNGVMNWKISGCGGTIGYNGATDSEVDVAMALIVADYQWGSAGTINYKNDAKTLISAIKNFEVESGSFVLKPGDQFGGSSNTNPSYFAPGYFRAFAAYTNDNFWISVADKCYVVINNNLSVNNAVGGLVSDWCQASGNYSAGRNYSYDAARTPWRIAVDYAWYGNASAKAYSKKSSDFVRINLGGSQNIKDGYSQNGSAISSYHNSTFVGAFACAAIGGDNQAHLDNSYGDLKGINDANSYFNQSLKTLYLFFLSGNFYLPGGTVVNPIVQAPYSGSASIVPGKIEAEKYDVGGTLAYNDLTAGNSGGQFRAEDVDIETTTDAGGGFNTGYTTAGEWLEYSVNVTNAGKYTIEIRVATTAVGKSMHIEMNGLNVTGNIALPNTAGWQNWQTVTVPNITLAAGTQIMKVVMDSDGFNLNYINVVTTTTTPQNILPALTITSPANNASFTAPASIAIAVNASDADGTVSKVEFYNGTILLNTDATAPFSYTWSAVDAGTYTITAKATDNLGATTSKSSNVVVTSSTGNTSCILPSTTALNYLVRNDWSDQGNGSGVSNATGAMKITHRQWGQSLLWVIGTGANFTVTAGRQYTISFDYQDDNAIRLVSMDVAFINGYGGSGPIEVQPRVATTGGFSTSFKNHTAVITAANSGSVNLAFKLNWAGQPSVALNEYIKNIKICSNGSSFKTGDFDYLSDDQSTTILPVTPNPSMGVSFVEVPENTFIKVLDKLGNVVLQKEVTFAGAIPLDLTNQTGGLYLIQTTTNGVTKSQKLILQK